MTDEQKLILKSIKKQNQKIKEMEKDIAELTDLVVLISKKSGIFPNATKE